MSDPNTSEYGISAPKTDSLIAAPTVHYLPELPEDLTTPIALVGAGGIAEYHLKSYRDAGLNVVAIVDRNKDKAEARCQEFFPAATAYTDYQALLERDDIAVIDVATHVDSRLEIVAACLKAGKHVLSQKPLVTDLDQADHLIQLAKDNKVLLAVNQNGRWAPHFSYMRNAIDSGIIGEVTSVDFSLQWDQTWIANISQYDEMKHMVLYDFSIHWFDILSTFLPGQQAQNVYATAINAAQQDYRPPSLASATISYPNALATLSLNAHTKLGERDVTTIVGTKGTLRSQGPGLNNQPTMELYLEEGNSQENLQGSWFTNGFLGTITELLCAIEQQRQPSNSAQNILPGLELCFAAIESAETGKVITPGSIRRLVAN